MDSRKYHTETYPANQFSHAADATEWPNHHISNGLTGLKSLLEPSPKTGINSPLLGLPGEVLEEILYWSVHPKCRTFKRALRLRLVCKTFEPLIAEALYKVPHLISMAMRKVKCPRIKKFSPQESYFWAEVHVRQISKRSRLPMYRTIVKMVDSYCDISNITDSQEKKHLLFTVCRPQNMAFYAPRTLGFESVYPFGPALQVDDPAWEHEKVLTRGLLAMCCLFNNSVLLEDILRRQPDSDRGGQEYLIRLAARSGHAEIVAVLFKIQYSINKPKLAYLLCEAALGGNTEVLTVLEDSNLQVAYEWRTCTPPWPLSGVSHPEFLERYLNSNLYHFKGEKHEAYTQKFREKIAIWCAEDNQVEMLRYLVETYGISDIARDVAIQEAAKGYATEAVQYLLKDRPPATEKWMNLEAPRLAVALRNAVNNGSFYITKMLLEHHASPDEYGYILSTPGSTNELFVFAVREEHTALLQLILRYVETSDGDWYQMLTTAESQGLDSMKALVLEEKEKCKVRKQEQRRKAWKDHTEEQLARLRVLSPYLVVSLIVGLASWSLSRQLAVREGQFSCLVARAIAKH